VAAKRKMTENFRKKSARGMASGKSVTMGKPTDGNGVQATQQRDRINGTKCERKSALVVGEQTVQALTCEL